MNQLNTHVIWNEQYGERITGPMPYSSAVKLYGILTDDVDLDGMISIREWHEETCPHCGAVTNL